MSRKPRPTALALLCILAAAGPGVRAQTAILAAPQPGPGSIAGAAQGQEGPEEGGFGAQAVLSAFTAAYPGRFSEPYRAGDDWGIDLDGMAFRWADGRLLPLSEAPNAAAYDRQPFYPYPDELPPQHPLTADEKARSMAAAAGRDRKPPLRSTALYDRLWGATDESAAWSEMKAFHFLGKPTYVHRDLLEEFAAVEADILAAAKTDREVAAWVEGLGSADCYFWRDVRGTESRSFHAYGVAIDLVPSRIGGKEFYWLDARAAGLAWYELPYSARLAVPHAVVAAFEKRGFIWGGKWLFWDTVHFEYRPEMLILNGRKVDPQPRVR